MKKIKTILIIALLILPLTVSAQFDFLLNNPAFNADQTPVEPDITLNDLKLIWSADTYTPFEYEGRALPTRGSKVTIIAMVDVSGGDPESLTYSWFLDDVFQEDKSGYGRETFDFRIRRFGGQNQTVFLKLFNDSRSFYTEKTITIPIADPEVVIYPSRSSDQGNRTSAIKAGRTSSFVAKPYFFSIEKLTDLTFEWHFANNARLTATSSTYGANILDLVVNQKSDSEISEQNLLIDVKNNLNSFQDASKMIKVQIY